MFLGLVLGFALAEKEAGYVWAGFIISLYQFNKCSFGIFGCGRESIRGCNCSVFPFVVCLHGSPVGNLEAEVNVFYLPDIFLYCPLK